MENIIVQDLNKVYKFTKNIFVWLSKGLPLLFRVMICLMISAITIKAFNIKEIIILNGWINVTVLIGMVMWQLILALYMKAYQLEKKIKTITLIHKYNGG